MWASCFCALIAVRNCFMDQSNTRDTSRSIAIRSENKKSKFIFWKILKNGHFVPCHLLPSSDESTQKQRIHIFGYNSKLGWRSWAPELFYETYFVFNVFIYSDFVFWKYIGRMRNFFVWLNGPNYLQKTILRKFSIFWRFWI